MGVLAFEYVGTEYRIVMSLITCLYSCSWSNSFFVIFYITFSSKESNKKERKMKQNQKGPAVLTYNICLFQQSSCQSSGALSWLLPCTWHWSGG